VRILIEPPAWIGDAVMATPAIENLIKFYDGAEISLVGSSGSLEIFRHHPSINKIEYFKKNYISIFSVTKELGEF